MHALYHIQITKDTLGEHFSVNALEEIITANLGQDRLTGLLFHPEYHFDNSLLDGNVYMHQQRELVLTSLKLNDPQTARQAFGRLTHAVQDFYAHSNYVSLWLTHNVEQAVSLFKTPHDQIDPRDTHILNHPDLQTVHIYYIRDALSQVPVLRKLIRHLSPKDSHTHMNLDSPASGPMFPFALSAARKRTLIEFNDLADRIQTELNPVLLTLFSGLETTNSKAEITINE